MKKRTVLGLILILLIFVANAYAQSIPKDLKFPDLVDNLSLTTKTELYVKNYWAKVLGQEVTWMAKVVNVEGGRNRAQIFAANSARGTYRGYNLVLTSYFMDAAANLQIGQTFKFKGILASYKGRKGNPIILYLNEVEIL